MNNVVRIKYLENLNQLWLIGSFELEHWLKSKGNHDNNDLLNVIEEYVSRVNSSSGNGVVLGGCITNLDRYFARSHGSNWMIFPISEREISYVFKGNVDCFKSNLNDPRIVYPASGIDIIGSAILFFCSNPFECDKYNNFKDRFFQGNSDTQCLHSRTRKNLVVQAGARGFGSLDIFV